MSHSAELNVCPVLNRLAVDTAEEAAGRLLQRPRRVHGQEGQLLLHPPDRWAAPCAGPARGCGVGAARGLSGPRGVGRASSDPGPRCARAGWWLKVGLSGVGGPCLSAPVSASARSLARSRSRRGRPVLSCASDRAPTHRLPAPQSCSSQKRGGRVGGAGRGALLLLEAPRAASLTLPPPGPASSRGGGDGGPGAASLTSPVSCSTNGSRRGQVHRPVVRAQHRGPGAQVRAVRRAPPPAPLGSAAPLRPPVQGHEGSCALSGSWGGPQR